MTDAMKELVEYAGLLSGGLRTIAESQRLNPEDVVTFTDRIIGIANELLAKVDAAERDGGSR